MDRAEPAPVDGLRSEIGTLQSRRSPPGDCGSAGHPGRGGRGEGRASTRQGEVTGQVTALYQATPASRIQGTIDELLVREGSPVRKGQTLMVLDNGDLQTELARMTAELDTADAQRKRMEDLYKKDAVSKQELENAAHGFRVEEAGRKAVLAQLSYTVVKAPFDGVITAKKVEVGELVSSGQPLLRMEDPTRFRLEVTVAESDRGLVMAARPFRSSSMRWGLSRSKARCRRSCRPEARKPIADRTQTLRDQDRRIGLFHLRPRRCLDHRAVPRGASRWSKAWWISTTS